MAHWSSQKFSERKRLAWLERRNEDKDLFSIQQLHNTPDKMVRVGNLVLGGPCPHSTQSWTLKDYKDREDSADDEKCKYLGLGQESTC